MHLNTASYLLVGTQAADTLHEHLQLTIQCYTQSPTSDQCTLQLVPHMLIDHQPTSHLHPDMHLGKFGMYLIQYDFAYIINSQGSHLTPTPSVWIQLVVLLSYVQCSKLASVPEQWTSINHTGPLLPTKSILEKLITSAKSRYVWLLLKENSSYAWLVYVATSSRIHSSMYWWKSILAVCTLLEHLLLSIHHHTYCPIWLRHTSTCPSHAEWPPNSLTSSSWQVAIWCGCITHV